MRVLFFLPALLLVLQSNLATGERDRDGCPVFDCRLPLSTGPVECIIFCRVGFDSDCGPNGKCCKDPCFGCHVCAERQPTPSVDSCQNKVCPLGQVCVEEPCNGKGCNPRARCVTPVQKPGTCSSALIRCALPLITKCPKRQCQHDGDCVGDSKCCSDCSRCLSCQRPLESRFTCGAVKCFGDEVCIEDPEARCVARSFKPGTCPTPSSRRACPIIPVGGCVSDAQCSGTRKCCFDGCSGVCTSPTRPIY